MDRVVVWLTIAFIAAVGVFVTGCGPVHLTCSDIGHPVMKGQPGYSRALDRNNDGTACE